MCAAVVVVLAALGACDAHQLRESAGPSGRTPGVSRAAGTSDVVREVQLRNVRLLVDPAGQDAGSSARVAFFAVNHADQPDELVGASSPQAEQVQPRWDRDCSGTADPVPALPISARGGVPPAAGQPDGAIPYDLGVQQLRQPVRPGTTFPVRFRFARAGEISVDAKVQPAEPPTAPCSAPPQPPVAEASGPVLTASGVVRTGPRPECRLLDSGQGAPRVLLGGDPAVVRPGARLEVSGSPVAGPDPCGSGPVLRVLTARPR